MIDTLYKIGKGLSDSEDYDPMDGIITPPKIKSGKNPMKLYSAEIIFDLDKGEVLFGDSLYPYSQDTKDKDYEYSAYSLRCLNIQTGNNKNIYPTVDSKNLLKFERTFFSVKDNKGNEPEKAELVAAIDKDFSHLSDTLLYKVVKLIFPLRKKFQEKLTTHDKVGKAKKSPDIEALKKHYDLKRNEKIILVFASIISKSKHSIEEKTPIVKLDGFDTFLKMKFLTKEKSSIKRMCYILGKQMENVNTPKFKVRYSLNKMFQTTLWNAASEFDKKAFGKNYQINNDVEKNIESGSNYILENYTVKIAGIDHCIIPAFLHSVEINFDQLIGKIKNNSDLLFNYKKEYESLESDFDFMGEGVFWVNFLGFESDGKSFKSTNEIKDISKTHFSNILHQLLQTEKDLSEINGMQWNEVMTYGKERNRYNFNLNTVYNLIPVRKGKKGLLGKRNPALIFFKSILEQRKVTIQILFQHFVKLIQIHRFQKKDSYQIRPIDRKNFDFAIRDSVFRYLAFIHFLIKLNLIDMESTTNSNKATFSKKEYKAAILNFFDKMNYDETQQGLFYLGRVLGSVAYAQFKSGHKKKPILNTLNYNGMDLKAIKRLRASLMEKCLQYNKYDTLRKNEFNFSLFNDLFNPEKTLSAEENLFYLLSGYAFRLDNEKKEDMEIEPELDDDSID